jgi:hypothetical protein
MQQARPYGRISLLWADQRSAPILRWSVAEAHESGLRGVRADEILRYARDFACGHALALTPAKRLKFKSVLFHNTHSVKWTARWRRLSRYFCGQQKAAG